jgi:hypothetical protein
MAILCPWENVPETPLIAGVPAFALAPSPPPPPQDAMAIDAIADRKRQPPRIASRNLPSAEVFKLKTWARPRCFD